MSTRPTQHQTIPNGVDPPTRTVPPWARPVAITTAAMFFVSIAFPLVAGLSKNTGAFPKWWGIADVVLVFVLAAMVFAVMVATHGKVSRQADDATYRAYRILIHGIFALLVVFFLAGDAITWTNCLTGLGWRAWLLLYALPAWFAALRTPASANAIPAQKVSNNVVLMCPASLHAPQIKPIIVISKKREDLLIEHG